jgi:hypothetical protein
MSEQVNFYARSADTATLERSRRRQLQACLLALATSVLSACAPHPPSSIQGGPGTLPKAEIQSVVRRNFGRFRLCYEHGLLQNPRLAGRVSTRLTIERDGSVSLNEDGGSTMPDRDVVACVVGGFSTLRFPSPEGGTLTFVYPIIFSPGD